MSPSDDQLQNLSRMEGIIRGNWKAAILVRSLWDFFNFQLYCDVLDEDGQPNKYSIKGIHDPDTISQVRFRISIRKNERQSEGLIHELLHANLIPLGYPRFWINADGEPKKFTLAAGIINLADHVPMLQTYLSLGYSANHFLGPSRALNERETRVQADLQKMSAELAIPQRYLNCVSRYLELNNIRFKPLHLTNAIIAQRFAE